MVFHKALTVQPDNVTARIDLATSPYRQRKLEDAETEAKPWS